MKLYFYAFHRTLGLPGLSKLIKEAGDAIYDTNSYNNKSGQAETIENIVSLIKSKIQTHKNQGDQIERIVLFADLNVGWTGQEHDSIADLTELLKIQILDDSNKQTKTYFGTTFKIKNKTLSVDGDTFHFDLVLDGAEKNNLAQGQLYYGASSNIDYCCGLRRASSEPVTTLNNVMQEKNIMITPAPEIKKVQTTVPQGLLASNSFSDLNDGIYPISDQINQSSLTPDKSDAWSQEDEVKASPSVNTAYVDVSELPNQAEINRFTSSDRSKVINGLLSKNSFVANIGTNQVQLEPQTEENDELKMSSLMMS